MGGCQGALAREQAGFGSEPAVGLVVWTAPAVRPNRAGGTSAMESPSGELVPSLNQAWLCASKLHRR